MVFARELAKRLADFVVARGLGNAQRLVIISELDSHWLPAKFCAGHRRATVARIPLRTRARLGATRCAIVAAMRELGKMLAVFGGVIMIRRPRPLGRIRHRLARPIAGRHPDRTRQLHLLLPDRHLPHHQHRPEPDRVVLPSVIGAATAMSPRRANSNCSISMSPDCSNAGAARGCCLRRFRADRSSAR